MFFRNIPHKWILFTTSFVSQLGSVYFCVPDTFDMVFCSSFFHKNIVFGLTHAKTLERKQCPEIYNIVENLCISRGLPMVKVGIIEDDSLNAFATGWTPKNSYIAFSRGLLKKLNKQEIEAVAAHELTHILNRDVRIMLLANIFVGIISTVGYSLMRFSGNTKSKKGNSQVAVVGIILYGIGVIILPLIQLAISRKREYLADAGSVELTKNKEAMISALQKISTDSAIEKSDPSLGAFFIHCPVNNTKKQKSKFFQEFFSTHPPISSRIELLKKY